MLSIAQGVTFGGSCRGKCKSTLGTGSDGESRKKKSIRTAIQTDIMTEHIGFMKRLMKLPFKELKDLQKKQKKIGLNEKGLRISRVDNEQFIIGGEKVRVHRCFVETRDSGEYKNVGWVVDVGVSKCMMCARAFGMLTYRHHCRSCGNVICHSCSPYLHEVMELPGQGPQRLCMLCYWHQDEVYAVFSPVKVSAGAKLHQLKEAEKERTKEETFAPNAVFVLKTSCDDSKIFVNVLHHENIPTKDPNPSPKRGIEASDGEHFLLSRGPRSSVDKKQNVCTVYDVMVNTNIMSSLTKDKTEQFCASIFTHIERKYNLRGLKRSVVIPSIVDNYKDGPIKVTSLALLTSPSSTVHDDAKVNNVSASDLSPILPVGPSSEM